MACFSAASAHIMACQSYHDTAPPKRVTKDDKVGFPLHAVSLATSQQHTKRSIFQHPGMPIVTTLVTMSAT
jgi:hypothetical protein